MSVFFGGHEMKLEERLAKAEWELWREDNPFPSIRAPWEKLIPEARKAAVLQAKRYLAALHEAAKDPASGVRVVEAMTLGSGVQVFNGVTLNGPVMQLNVIVPGPGKAIVIFEEEKG